MAEIRLGIAVDASGAIKSVQTFNAELGKTPESASKADGALGGLKRQFDNFVSGLSIGAGIAVATRAFDAFSAMAKSATTALLTYSDRIVTLGQRTLQSLASLQVFNAVAKTSGTDLETVAKAATLMEVAIGKGSTSFSKLGLSVKELQGLSPDDAFAKVAASIGSIEDPAQRAAAAVEIFGKRGAEMLPIFTQNLAEAKQQALDFGLVLGDKTLQAAESLGDAIDTTGMAFDAFLMRLVGAVAESPAVMRAFTEIGRLFGDMSKWLDDNKADLISWVNEGVEVAADAIVFLTGTLRAFLLMARAGSGPAGWLDIGGAFEKADAIMASMSRRAKDFRTSIKQAAIDMGGLGVLLPGGKLPPQGGGRGGGVFDPRGAIEIKVQELKLSYDNLPGPGQFMGPNNPYAGFWNQGGALPPEIAAALGGVRSRSNLDPHLTSITERNIYEPTINASKTLSQSLQNLANVAALSSSKLGKFVAGLAGNLAAITGSLTNLGKISGTGKLATSLSKFGEYGQIAAAVLNIGSSIFGLFKKKPKEPPPEPPKQATAEAWRNFTGDQLSRAGAGVLAGVSGIRVTTPEDMAAQASIANQVFWAVFREKGPAAAAEAFKGVRDKMIETFKAAGASDETIAALLGQMSTQIDLSTNEAFSGAASGLQGYAEALAGLVNSQMPMTIEQFRAFEQQAVAGFEQMKQAALDQGLSMEDAIKSAATGSAQYLQTIRDAAARYGFDLGDGTQNLFDQANAAGVSFGSDSQERLIMSLDRLTETLGGTPPRFEQAVANATNGLGDRISRGANTGINGGRGESPEAAAAPVVGAVGELNSSLSDAIATLAAAIMAQPTVVNIDGQSALAALAGPMQGGGPGSQAFATALEGRG